MPFKLGTKTIQLDTPFTHNDIQYPANWIRLASEADKSAIGLVWEADPVRASDVFYWDGNINNPKALEDKLEVDQDGRDGCGGRGRCSCNNWRCRRGCSGQRIQWYFRRIWSKAI